MRLRPQLGCLILALASIASSASAQDFWMNTAGARSTGLGGIYAPSSSDVMGALYVQPRGTDFSSRPQSER